MSGQEKKEEDFFTIFVRDTFGKQDLVNVVGSHKVSQLKTILSVKKGLNVTIIGLIFGGDELDNEKTLAECNICKGNTVFMMYKVM
jgi:hypothetical protein